MSDINGKVLKICNIDMVDKSVFDPIFNENITSVLNVVKEVLRKGVALIKNQDEFTTFMTANSEMIVFGTHLTNALQIKNLFKFNPSKPVDFFKYYEKIDNENPARLAHLLGVV